jgi:hypothetical protein
MKGDFGMTLVCAWCDTFLGKKAPLNKPGVTHGMCARCLSERLGPREDTFRVTAARSYGFAEAASPAH